MRTGLDVAHAPEDPPNDWEGYQPECTCGFDHVEGGCQLHPVSVYGVYVHDEIPCPLPGPSDAALERWRRLMIDLFGEDWLSND